MLKLPHIEARYFSHEQIHVPAEKVGALRIASVVNFPIKVSKNI